MTTAATPKTPKSTPAIRAPKAIEAWMRQAKTDLGKLNMPAAAMRVELVLTAQVAFYRLAHIERLFSSMSAEARQTWIAQSCKGQDQVAHDQLAAAIEEWAASGLTPTDSARQRWIEAMADEILGLAGEVKAQAVRKPTARQPNASHDADSGSLRLFDFA